MSRPEYVSEIRFYKTSGNGRFEGSGAITVADSLAIKFTIFSNESNTMRVVFPNETNPNFDAGQPITRQNQKYFDLVYPISKEARTAIETTVINELLKTRETENYSQSMDSTVPF